MRYEAGYLAVDVEDDDPVTQRTLSSFGYEWTTFDRIMPEDEEYWRRYFADVEFDPLKDVLALDAGCGKGRFSRFTAKRVKGLVALDGSDAVRSAARNLKDLTNVLVMKCDIREIPFEDESFGLVYCLGVLHHLKNPEVALAELVRVLAPGGQLLVYVYSRPHRRGIRAASLWVATGLRRLTVHLPHRVVRWVSFPLAAFLYTVFVLPGSLGARRGLKSLDSLPLGTYRERPLRSLWLDTFDRLSAPIEQRYLWKDIEGWFRSANLEVIRVREDAGLIVLSSKPAR